MLRPFQSMSEYVLVYVENASPEEYFGFQKNVVVQNQHFDECDIPTPYV